MTMRDVIDLTAILEPVFDLRDQHAPPNQVQEAVLDAYGALKDGEGRIKGAMTLLEGMSALYGAGLGSLDFSWMTRRRRAGAIPAPQFEPQPAEEPAPIAEPSPMPFERTSEAVVSIARTVSGPAMAQIRSSDVIDRLRELGDTTERRALAVAVGNVLNRAGWRRVRPGVYAPPAKEGE